MKTCNKNEHHLYLCQRCQDCFVIHHYIDANGAICTPCFTKLKAVTSAEEYQAFLDPSSYKSL